jgi:hypothetical protein
MCDPRPPVVTQYLELVAIQVVNRLPARLGNRVYCVVERELEGLDAEAAVTRIMQLGTPKIIVGELAEVEMGHVSGCS